MKPASQKRLCPPGNSLSRSGASQHSVSAERARRQQLSPKGADSLSLSRKRACGSTSGLSQGQGLQGPPLTIGYRELLGSGGWGVGFPKWVVGRERHGSTPRRNTVRARGRRSGAAGKEGGGGGGRSPPLLPRCPPTAPRSPRCLSTLFGQRVHLLAGGGGGNTVALSGLGASGAGAGPRTPGWRTSARCRPREVQDCVFVGGGSRAMQSELIFPRS